MILLDFIEALDILAPYYKEDFAVDLGIIKGYIENSMRLNDNPAMVEKLINLGIKLDENQKLLIWIVKKQKVMYQKFFYTSIETSLNGCTTKNEEILRKNGASELSIAIRNDKSFEDIKKLFEENPESLFQKDKFGSNALHEASYKGNVALLDLFESYAGQNHLLWNSSDSYYNTSLHHATYAKQFAAAN